MSNDDDRHKLPAVGYESTTQPGTIQRPSGGFEPGRCGFCENEMMLRAGSCLVCAACGTTTGCS